MLVAIQRKEEFKLRQQLHPRVNTVTRSRFALPATGLKFTTELISFDQGRRHALHTTHHAQHVLPHIQPPADFSSCAHLVAVRCMLCTLPFTMDSLAEYRRRYVVWKCSPTRCSVIQDGL